MNIHVEQSEAKYTRKADNSLQAGGRNLEASLMIACVLVNIVENNYQIHYKVLSATIYMYACFFMFLMSCTFILFYLYLSNIVIGIFVNTLFKTVFMTLFIAHNLKEEIKKFEGQICTSKINAMFDFLSIRIY